MTQVLKKHQHQKQKLLYKNELASAALRKKRTRTLIQLGGLIEKAGLLGPFNIHLGDDLQKDLPVKDQVLTLFGGLLELKDLILKEDYSPTLWKAKAAPLFAQGQEKKTET